MAQSSYPFENSDALGELEWSKVFKILGTGVVLNEGNNLLVYADSTGMRVKVKDGEARVRGTYYESSAEEILAINAADSTNPRIDRIILRLDWAANSVLLAILQGAPAVSPVAPALTQNTTRWEISLAQVLVNANAVTIVAGNVTDERVYANGSALSRSRNNFLGDPNHQAYGSADTRISYPRNEFTRGITSLNSDGSFQINEAGQYLIVAQGQAQRGSTTDSYQVFIKKNGAFLKTIGDFPFSTSVDVHYFGSCMVDLVPGDIIEVWIHLYQTTSDYFFPFNDIQISKVR